MKRLFDIGVSLMSIVVFSPVLLIVTMAILLFDGRPVLFRQRRVGLGGAIFSILKFRSMVVNAEQCGGYSTAEGDPRITIVGRFIRRTSLDELPQLFNVLLGDMSIVGPRPDVPEQRALYSDGEWVLRHRVRPGVTGPAQATLRSSASPEQRKELDLAYASAGESLWRDLGIIALTVGQVLGKGGN